MTNKTTIQVSEEVKDLLEAKKERNESMNDVLKRELDIGQNDERRSLTAYLSDEKTRAVELLIDLITTEFDLTTVYTSASESDTGFPEVEFRHPESEMPIAQIDTSETTDSYTLRYRNAKGEMTKQLRNEPPEAIDENVRNEITRRVGGAYETYS